MQPSKVINIRYQLISENNIKDIASLVAEHLATRVYLTKDSCLVYDELYEFAMLYCQMVIPNQLSLIAIDEINKQDKIVGFAISEDLSRSGLMDTLKLNKKFEPFIKILDDLFHTSIDFDVRQGLGFHLFLLGVIPSYQGYGIETELVKQSEVLAEKLKFLCILIKATGPRSKQLCDALDYTPMGQLAYSDYVFNGSKPFAHLKDFDGPYMYMKNF